MNNLVKRGLTGAVFVAVIIGAVLGGPLSFSVLFLVIIFASANELLNLTLDKDGYLPRKILCLIATVLPSFLIALGKNGLMEVDHGLALGFFIFTILLLFIAELFSKSTKPFKNLGFSCLCIVYVGFFLAFIFYLAFRKNFFEPHIILGVLVLTWSCDTFAYLTGSAIGKTPLFKRISPKKTIEGSFGGLICTIGIACILSIFFLDYPLIDWLMIGVIACVIGTMGDLTESMLKRSLNIKDSGTILPGHGGFLDRFDSFILIVPAVSAYFMIKYGI